MQFLAGLLLCASFAASQAVIQPQNAMNSPDVLDTTIIDLKPHLNNRGFGKKVGDANFDTYHSSYPAKFLPKSPFIYNGINFTFPQYKAAGNDNMLSQGQKIEVPPGKYIRVSMLAAAESSFAPGALNATYKDGSSSAGQILVPAWWSWPYPSGGDIIFPYYFSNKSINYNTSNIFQTVNWLDSGKTLTSITLPNVTNGVSSGVGGLGIPTRLHIFAMSLIPAGPTTKSAASNAQVQYARTTQKWLPNTNKTQIVEVLINNPSSSYILAKDSLTVEVVSPGLKTVQPGVVKRLRPGDQVMVEVGVVNKQGVKSGTPGNATIAFRTPQGLQQTAYTFNATYGYTPFKPTFESIYGHESPSWYNQGKFGIFIHWGVYAVPGWGNVGKNETYAEWYWWNLNRGPNTTDQTYEHHQKTYGPNVVYDDFIANFTASAWDPKEWVDLFADSGAQYFVQVSKHHDGYAIFDLPQNVSKRTSVALTPHRNLLQELFDAAKKYQPHLHRATYYSLPEWFHPDYKKYGFASWPGGNALNPFNNKTEKYTGYVPVKDYIKDVILPEMNTLADMGTEIMWCDIGGPNMTAEFAAKYFNDAAKQGRQVAIDSRCGLPGDFDTPEYARYGAVQRRKWESNLGMDPFSFGYNRATPPSGYQSPTVIVTSLVDIISKNGNFLLDVGPTANGTIVEIEQTNLRKAGTWIKQHGEAIYNTSYWFVTPAEGDNIRFTTATDAFYILMMKKPGKTLTIESPVPWIEGDKVTVVGGKMNGTVVPSSKSGEGVKLNISSKVANADQYTWVFKISY